MIAATLAVALALDTLLGEPRRWHPLVGFGRLVAATEQWLRRDNDTPPLQQGAGLLAWLVLVLAPASALWWLLAGLSVPWRLAAEILVLYLALGNRSLAEHARAVAAPLAAGDIVQARQAVAMMVSRDCDDLDELGVTRAAAESVLENGSDAVLASLFWFAVAGAPGVVLHRLANTLDACWGYRCHRYRYFGRAAARLDDTLNWLPARLCALSYGLVGNLPGALRCWRLQAHRAASPNAGPVMAAGAGALGIRLGGSAHYGGREEWRPTLGQGRDPEPRDIQRALGLLWRTLALWLALVVVIELSHGVIAGWLPWH